MKVHVKVWTSDLKECETFVLHCLPRDEAQLMVRFTGEVLKHFPDNTLRSIRIGPGRYNLIPQPAANA